MYHRKIKNGMAFSLLIWLLDMVCLYLAGRFSNNDYAYWSLGTIPAATVVLMNYLRNHNWKDLGFYPDHLKQDGLVMLCMFVIELLVGVYIFHMPWGYAVRNWLYYIFWIAFQEELVFRGFIQSHLFSTHINRKISYLIGSAMFSVSYIPYQMQIRSWDVLFFFATYHYLCHTPCVLLDCREEKKYLYPLGDPCSTGFSDIILTDKQKFAELRLHRVFGKKKEVLHFANTSISL